MAKLLIIGPNCAKRKVERGVRKTEAEDHAIQTVDDIIGVFPDTHEFSPTEQDIFKVFYVWGSVKDVKGWLPKVKRRATSSSEEEWENPEDSKWYKLKARKKFEINISSLSLQDKQNLASSLTNEQDRISAFNNMTNKIKEDLQNTSEPVSG